MEPDEHANQTNVNANLVGTSNVMGLKPINNIFVNMAGNSSHVDNNIIYCTAHMLTQNLR